MGKGGRKRQQEQGKKETITVNNSKRETAEHSYNQTSFSESVVQEQQKCFAV